MANTLDISKAVNSDYTNQVTDITIDSKNTDGVQGGEETEFQNTNWAKYWGYFNAVPELKSAVLMKALFNVGKGYEADMPTKVILEHITGWGKDTFDDILFNMEVIKRVGGDSYAEIIRDPETNLIVNLKPLDPGAMKLVVNKSGIIIRYEQMSKVKGKSPTKFKPKDILHLSNNRLADQIHGISDIESLEPTILAENENFTDMKKLMHHQVKPFIIWKLGTDDDTKISALVAKINKARNLGEDTFIPDDDDALSYEVVTLNPSAIIMEWRNDIRNKFYRSIGLPQIVPGAGGQGTESETKVIYLAFEQIVKKDQMFLEKQIYNQLLLKIKLIPPTSMMENLQTDENKDVGTMNPQMPMENPQGAL